MITEFQCCVLIVPQHNIFTQVLSPCLQNKPYATQPNVPDILINKGPCFHCPVVEQLVEVLHLSCFPILNRFFLCELNLILNCNHTLSH